jgi:nucleotide-binding universal stress UspA family protein
VKAKEKSVEFAPSVLVLTDFSEGSKEALRWAEHLATHHNANLKVLYPYRLTQMSGKEDVFQIKRDIEVEAKNDFAKIAESVFKDRIPPYDFKAEVGFLNDRVYSYTRKSEILMVVINKKMANTNREALDELLDKLRTPLLIVPQNDL